ncbi:unnamed protein product [Lactuca saligna]|uniref:Uncharacterized protein n=1 Tax=Lactuca saligna TaxID=75948 RepID=A0AA35YRS7_LACSI|nr:unnamed protein product [Lactuca saligna]
MMYDPTKFGFVGSIPSEMLERVPQDNKPKSKDEKDNKASTSKGKEKVIDDEEEKEELSEGEKLVRKKHDSELDDILRIHKELEDQEMEAKAAKVTLETQKSFFPPWTLKRIQKEAVDEPSTSWFEPLVSFELNNTADSQLDFSITPRAFLFRCFEKIERAPISNNDANQMLFSFYLKYGKPQFKTWSWKKIVVVKVYAPVPTENFINIKSKEFRGTIRVENDFTLANLPS